MATSPLHTLATHDLDHAHRVIGEVHCGICGWSAILTDDTDPEVRRFLIDELLAHLETTHPEHLHT